jgi:predicted  nucleic acid-binding Zn-ribbon protein
MSAAVRYGARAGEDPFAKVKGMINDMITKLTEAAEADAAKQGYCVKEMAETKSSKATKEAEIEKLSTKIDKMTTDSAKLKEEVSVLQTELANMASSQSEMDKIRAEEKALYDDSSAEMEKGLTGIKKALMVLRDYYAKGDSTASGDAGGGIISMLEVCESDFQRDLDETIATEKMAVAMYEKTTKENEMSKLTKDQDVKYKTKEAKSLDEGVAELSGDLSGVQTELAALNDYWNKLQSECIVMPASYEETKKAREEEVAGLKDALEILETEAALIQKSSKHTTLRGTRVHRA